MHDKPGFRRVFHNGPGGHYANLMIKFLVALRMRDYCPGLQISNFSMPYWGLDYPPLPQPPDEIVVTDATEQHVAFDRLSYLLRTGLVDRIEWRGYGARMENFPHVDLCRAVFANDTLGGIAYDATRIVCPLRGGEVINGEHGGYVQIPASFYRDTFDRLQLQPVFMGQVEDNPYIANLMRVFPDATFRPSMGPLQDFQTIRMARNLVVSVSTFAWMGAWLSRAERIVMPVIGLYQPEQFPQVDLLPIGDPRYEFHRFPIHWGVRADQILDAHATIEGQWSMVDPARYVRLSGQDGAKPSAARNRCAR